MSIQFHPLAADIATGILVRDGRGGPKPRAAEFLTPSEAKCRALAKFRKEERATLAMIESEAAQPEWYPER